MNTNVNEKPRNFSNFIKLNHDKIYATTPRTASVSKDDEWMNETEWDDLFELLSTKEK